MIVECCHCKSVTDLLVDSSRLSHVVVCDDCSQIYKVEFKKYNKEMMKKNWWAWAVFYGSITHLVFGETVFAVITPFIGMYFLYRSYVTHRPEVIATSCHIDHKEVAPYLRLGINKFISYALVIFTLVGVLDYMMFSTYEGPVYLFADVFCIVFLSCAYFYTIKINYRDSKKRIETIDHYFDSNRTA